VCAREEPYCFPPVLKNHCGFTATKQRDPRERNEDATGDRQGLQVLSTLRPGSVD
jgi:hypothetical protein